MMAYEGGTSADAFLRFAREALAPSLHPGDVVVMDNRVLYLPPYHPELNPIELAWSKLKALLKRIGARALATFTRSLRR
jgi:transposase